MTEHSDLGPSALSRILACPGSYALSQRPEVKALGNRGSWYAARGSVAHRVAEQTIGGEAIDKGTTTYRGYDIDVDDDMVDAVTVYTELVEAFISVCDWHVIEQRVSLDEYWLPNAPPVPVFGTTDFAGFMSGPRLLRVIDYKHGSGVLVGVQDNPQALAYAAGALLICPGDVASVEITIVQPNASVKQKVKTVCMSVLDLLLWVHEVLIPGIARTQSHPFDYKDGPQCRFCPGAMLCPLLAQDAMEEAMQQFHEVSLATPEEVSQALDQADRAEIWVKAVREFAKLTIEGGTKVPYWDLVPTRPVRSWDDPDQVSRMLAAFDDDVVYEWKLRSPAQLEKHLKGDVWDQLNPHIQRLSSGTKLQREGG